MRVRLDDRELTVDGVSLDDALAAAAGRAEEAGRIIVEVIVDGRLLSESDLASTDERQAIPERVELTSADLTETILRTLRDASEALTDADELQRNAAAAFQADQAQNGYAAFQEALSIWTDVQQAVVAIASAIGANLEEIPCGSGKGTDGIARLNDLLRQLRSAIEDQDPVTLADILMYDMPDATTDWRAMLDGMAERVSGANV